MLIENIENQFESLVKIHFRFLEEKGYKRCPLFHSNGDPRDAAFRLRYYSHKATIDVELTVGLGLFSHISIGTLNPENPCQSFLGSKTVNVETVQGGISLPPEIRILKSKTLYEGYKHIFTYQKVVAKYFYLAVEYLGRKTQEVEQLLTET